MFNHGLTGRTFIKLFVFLLLALPGVSLAEAYVEVSARDGVTQPFLWMGHDKPSATVILFAGGKGKIKLKRDGSIGKSGNFLVRSRDLFYQQGLNVAVVDAPSDHYGSHGMYYGFRHSAEHAEDVAAIIAAAWKRSSVPVWLVGTSRGTESVANAAIRLGQQLDGIVLTASLTVTTKKGTAITERELDEIKVPVLIASHEKDGCFVTPPTDSDVIQLSLTSAVKVVIKMYSGGKEPISKPCKAKSQHGFYGIEAQVVADIAAFIKNSE